MGESECHAHGAHSLHNAPTACFFSSYNEQKFFNSTFGGVYGVGGSRSIGLARVFRLTAAVLQAAFDSSSM